MSSDIQPAGREFAGYACATCDDEIAPTDVIEIDPDGEPDGDGGWHNLTTVTHHPVCPPDEAA